MKISIIIPTYNCERYIKRCVESVKAQTYSDWECIIVDDGSGDGTWETLKSVAYGDKRFRLFKRLHAGVAQARNAGVENAKGEALFFLDADDWIEPGMLAYLVEEHDRNPKAGRIFTPPIVHRELEGYTNVWGFSPKGMHGIDSASIFRDAKCDPGHCTGCLYVLDNIRNGFRFEFDESVPVIDDLLFNMGFHFAGNTTFITDGSFYHYHRHGGSLVTAYPFSYSDAENANRALEELRERYNPPQEVFIACRRHLNDIVARQLSKIIYK